MGPFDPDLLGAMLRECRTARGAPAKGKALEDLVQHVLTSIPSVELFARDVIDLDGTQEVDLVFSHYQSLSFVPIHDVTIITECKNERSKTSSEQITRFAAKLRARNVRTGLFVTYAGLAGKRRPVTSAHAAVRDELSSGISIIVVTAAELAAQSDADQLTKFLSRRLLELITIRGYLSI